jgi:RNA polymerase sigma factor (sigma-70 family)
MSPTSFTSRSIFSRRQPSSSTFRHQRTLQRSSQLLAPPDTLPTFIRLRQIARKSRRHGRRPLRLGAAAVHRVAIRAIESRHQYNCVMDATERAAPIATLLENHRAFLGYLERRVGDRALAEDILQDAFAKIVARPEQAPDDQGVVPWFYRTLRNAAIDQFRRRGAADRAHQAFARELETQEAPTSEMEAEICACVSRLADTLKPEYAEALQAIEVGGTPVKQFAEQHGLSSSNAAVRVFRAREALKKRVAESCGTCAEHGCVNCTCKQP